MMAMPSWSNIVPHLQMMAERLAAHVNADQAKNNLSFTVEEARIMVGEAFGAPRDFYESERDRHRTDAHGGRDGGDDCAVCGFIEASVYHAQTGRSLSKDFHGIDLDSH